MKFPVFSSLVVLSLVVGCGAKSSQTPAASTRARSQAAASPASAPVAAPAGPYSSFSVKLSGSRDQETTVYRMEDEPECVLVSVLRYNRQETDPANSALQLCISSEASLSGADTTPEGERSAGQLATSLISILNGEVPLFVSTPTAQADSAVWSYSVIPASGTSVEVAAPQAPAQNVVNDLMIVTDWLGNP